MIFVDTSAWYALASVRDANHHEAKAFIDSLHERLVTSDYVIDETLTLFRARGENQHAVAFGRDVIDGNFAEIISIEKLDFQRAWEVFQGYVDKEWSFTDCTSRAVMERLRIERAFAFDDHFQQFGTVTTLP